MNQGWYNNYYEDNQLICIPRIIPGPHWWNGAGWTSRAILYGGGEKKMTTRNQLVVVVMALVVVAMIWRARSISCVPSHAAVSAPSHEC